MSDIYCSIFRRGTGAQSPFSDPSWPILLFPEEMPRRVSRYFGPLATLAQSLGDRHVIMADEHRPEVVVTSSWVREEFLEKAFKFPLGALAFGVSGVWGAVLGDAGYTCVGGRADFVKELAAELGGRELVREEFDRWLESVEGFDLVPARAAVLRRLNRWEP